MERYALIMLLIIVELAFYLLFLLVLSSFIKTYFTVFLGDDISPDSDGTMFRSVITKGESGSTPSDGCNVKGNQFTVCSIQYKVFLFSIVFSHTLFLYFSAHDWSIQ